MSGFSGATEGGVLHGYDVVNNLNSTETNQPLSAAQGKALKDLIAQSTANLASCKIISSSSKATHVLNLASGSRHMIVALATQANNTFCVTASVTSSGAVTILELGKGDNVTLTTSTNTLTCTMTASNGLVIADFAIFGDFVTVS